jgi:predicted RNA-binding protein YlxR (DUF448 family)
MSRGGRPRSEPLRTRTCLGCRRRDNASEFLRLSFVDGALKGGGAVGGRGAYLCRASDCWTKGARGVGRALRRPGLNVTPDQLRTLLGAR